MADQAAQHDSKKRTGPSSDSEMEDVKPNHGHIPASTPLRPSTEGKQFFKVELLVGEDQQTIFPFWQDHVCRELSIDHYVVELGVPFAVCVKLAKPRNEGALYGARVYIDSGDANRDVVYKRWSDKDGSDNTAQNDDNNKVDTSKADHYFWFGTGQTEHIVQGFYRSQTTSNAFKFCKPKLTPTSDEPINPIREGENLGTIRIAFSVVKGFDSEGGNESNNFKPKRARVDERLDQKVRAVAKPGKVIHDGELQVQRREAILSEELVFERRLFYNTFEGLSARNAFQKHTHKVDFYKAMPLKALMHQFVRKQAISSFFRHVGESRVERSTQNRINQMGDGGIVDLTYCVVNEFVRVEDIVHHICQCLSPAASFRICTGKAKKGEYGEQVVQRSGHTKEEGLKDYCLKEKGLVGFFMSEPGLFDIEFVGLHETKLPRENYRVRQSIVELD